MDRGHSEALSDRLGMRTKGRRGWRPLQLLGLVTCGAGVLEELGTESGLHVCVAVLIEHELLSRERCHHGAKHQA